MTMVNYPIPQKKQKYVILMLSDTKTSVEWIGNAESRKEAEQMIDDVTPRYNPENIRQIYFFVVKAKHLYKVMPQPAPQSTSL